MRGTVDILLVLTLDWAGLDHLLDNWGLDEDSLMNCPTLIAYQHTILVLVRTGRALRNVPFFSEMLLRGNCLMAPLPKYSVIVGID